VPNPSPSVEELQKQNQELQNQLKEKDTQIADLNTTKATIEARNRQIAEEVAKGNLNKNIEDRAKRIMQNAQLDPDGAAIELSALLAEIQTNASREAVTYATQSMQSQTFIEKLQQEVKKENPDFDDDVVGVIMRYANDLAATGKYKTAEEAVKAAIQFVKSKFDGYATKKNATPPLPSGAGGESGPNKPPEPSSPIKEITPLEELENRKGAQQKKIL
jgi:cell division protein FtsB